MEADREFSVQADLARQSHWRYLCVDRGAYRTDADGATERPVADRKCRATEFSRRTSSGSSIAQVQPLSALVTKPQENRSRVSEAFLDERATLAASPFSAKVRIWFCCWEQASSHLLCDNDGSRVASSLRLHAETACTGLHGHFTYVPGNAGEPNP
jgi:hypothetical protein